jgi:iron-sulfur cluster assembly protein
MITVTDSAAKKIKRNLEQRGKGFGIRVGVTTTGCAGYRYVLEYVDAFEPGDVAMANNYTNIIVDKKSLIMLDGMTIDYVRQGLNEGFEFINPNEKSRCGCDASFTF